jgi:O-antigen/teichoic acid export membrane protein
VSSVDPAAGPVTVAPSLVRSVFGHGATYVLAGVANQAIAFLLFPLFAHVLKPRDYGIIDLVAMVMTLTNLVIALGVTNGMTRYLADASSPEESRAFASTALAFTVAAFTAAAAVALAAVGPLTRLVFGHGVRTALMEVGIAIAWGNALLSLVQLVLRFQLRPRASALVTLATGIVTGGLSATLVLGFHAGVMGALVGQAAGIGAGVALAFALTRDVFGLRFDWGRLRMMLVYSVPLIPAGAGVFLNEYVDRIAIRSELPLASVGVYGVGFRFSIIVGLTLLGFQSALMPLLLSRHHLERTPGELAHVVRLFCAIALTVFLLVSLFADEALRILARPAYYGAASVVPYLVAASFCAGMYMFAPGPAIAKRTRSYGAVVGVSGLVNAALAFALVGPLGIKGPAIAFLVASVGSLAVLMALSERLYPVPHRWRDLLLVAAGVSGLVVVSRVFIGETVELESFAGKVALALAGLALILRLLRREELAELARLPLRAAGCLRSPLRRAPAQPRAKQP